MPLPVSLRRAAFALLVLSTGACVDTLDIPDARYGVVSLAAYQDDVTGVAVAPEVVFYDKTDLRVSPPVVDSCVVSSYNPNPSVGASAATLSGGDSLVITVRSRSDTLRPFFIGALAIYRPPTGRVIPLVPGDTVSLQVPGSAGGFPAVTANTRTAEAFTHDPVVLPATGQPLTLTWTPAPVPGSQMTFSLRYANAFAADQTPNEQIFCGFADDGSGTIRPDVLDFFRNAPAASRSVRAIRIRVKEVVIDSRTRLGFISTYGVPLLPAP